MGKLIDLTGMKFGRLTVIERGEDYIDDNFDDAVKARKEAEENILVSLVMIVVKC